MVARSARFPHNNDDEPCRLIVCVFSAPIMMMMSLHGLSLIWSYPPPHVTMTTTSLQACHLFILIPISVIYLKLFSTQNIYVCVRYIQYWKTGWDQLTTSLNHNWFRLVSEPHKTAQDHIELVFVGSVQSCMVFQIWKTGLGLGPTPSRSQDWTRPNTNIYVSYKWQ